MDLLTSTPLAAEINPARVEGKDVMIALFAASVGLAGLLLVFEGFIIGAYAGLPKVIPEETRKPLRTAAWTVFAVLLLAVLAIASSLIWLLTQQWFRLAVWTFVATLAAIPCLGFYVSKELTK